MHAIYITAMIWLAGIVAGIVCAGLALLYSVPHVAIKVCGWPVSLLILLWELLTQRDKNRQGK